PARFHDVFCADVSDADAAFMAISQRPVSATAFDDPATAAAWRAKPSWAVFGTGDYPVAPELHRFSFDRAGSTVTEVEGASHFLMMSQPDIVAGVIREAVVASAVNVAACRFGIESVSPGGFIRKWGRGSHFDPPGNLSASRPGRRTRGRDASRDDADDAGQAEGGQHGVPGRVRGRGSRRHT